MEGAHARDELNIQANSPSPLLYKSSVQKGGAYFQKLTVCVNQKLNVLKSTTGKEVIFETEVGKLRRCK